jgi:hypothetical protein
MKTAEAVHFILDYVDGPVSGIADRNGSPHFFEVIFDDNIDDFRRACRVFKISPNTLRQVYATRDAWREHVASGYADSSHWESAMNALVEQIERDRAAADIVKTDVDFIRVGLGINNEAFVVRWPSPVASDDPKS